MTIKQKFTVNYVMQLIDQYIYRFGVKPEKLTIQKEQFDELTADFEANHNTVENQDIKPKDPSIMALVMGVPVYLEERRPVWVASKNKVG